MRCILFVLEKLKAWTATCKKDCPMARLNNQSRHPPISSQVQVTRCMTELSELYSVHPCLCLNNRNHGLRLCQKNSPHLQKKCPMVRLNNQSRHPLISSQVQVTCSTTEVSELYKGYAYLCFIYVDRNGVPGPRQKNSPVSLAKTSMQLD